MTQEFKSVKKRNWAFVCYPESFPANWLDILQKTCLKIAISPLHDKYLNPDEEEKKPHYHVICCWDSGSVRFTQAEKISKLINGTIPIPLESVRGYYRYFTHKDNPEKYQYDEKDIKHFNGFEIRDFIELTKSEMLKLKLEIINLIRANDIFYYHDLLELLEKNGNFDLLETALNNTYLFSSFLRSIREKRG